MTLVSTAAKSAGGAGSMSVIRQVTLAVDTASIDVASIPTSAVHLMLVAQLRSTVAAVSDQWGLRFNNDSGANYAYEYLDANQAAVAAVGFAAQTSPQGLMVGGTGTANEFTGLQIWIPNYAGAFLKTYHGHSFEQRTGVNVHYTGVGGVWNSTSAINRLTFIPVTGPNFLAGSSVTLYGLVTS